MSITGRYYHFFPLDTNINEWEKIVEEEQKYHNNILLKKNLIYQLEIEIDLEFNINNKRYKLLFILGFILILLFILEILNLYDII